MGIISPAQVIQEDACMCAKSLRSCLTLCDPMNWNPPGSSVHGILQARILEWIRALLQGNLPNPVVNTVSPEAPIL